MKSLLAFGLFWGLSVCPIALSLSVPVAVFANTPQEQAKDYFKRSVERLKVKDFGGAIEQLDLAIAMTPDEPELYFSRGYVKQQGLQDYAGAVLDYDRLISLREGSRNEFLLNDPMNYGFRGLAKVALNQRAGAIADFRKGLALARSQNNSGLAAVMQANLRSMGVSE
jgi:tetratricopeptide (TPR) repeat protein